MLACEESIVDIRFESNLFNFMIYEFGYDIEIVDNGHGSYNGKFISKMGKNGGVVRDDIKNELMYMVTLY